MQPRENVQDSFAARSEAIAAPGCIHEETAPHVLI
jgi:hypothetical protein